VPVEDVTYAGFEEELSVCWERIEGGSVEGRVTYEYGNGTEVGRERKGESVRGTWARRGCGSIVCR
jgi:hypothetical protein